MLTCSFSVSHLIKHDKTPLWTQRCLTIEPPVWKIVNITSWWHPACAKSQDHNLGPFLTLTQPPYAPAAFPRTLCPLASLRRKVKVFSAIPGGALNEKSQGLWVYLIHWQLRKLENEDWFQGIAALVKEDKCQTESDCLCDDNWSTLHSWTINILQTPKLHPCILNHNLPWRVLSLNCLNFRFP